MKPGERSEPQKTTYYTIPLLQNFQDRQIYRNRKQTSGCLELGEAELVPTGIGVFFRVIKQFKIRLQRWLQNSINTLKTAWLHTSKGSSVWYVKYIPIQLLCFKNGTRHYRFCEDSSRTNFSPTRKPPCPRLCTEGKGCRSGDRRSLCSLSADTV